MKNKRMYYTVSLTIIIFTCLFLAFFTVYADSPALLKDVRLYSEIRNGRLLHFYDAIDNTGYSLNANLLCRLPLLLWYFPGFVIANLLNIEFSTSFFGLLWHKTLLVLALMWTIRSMIAILSEADDEYKRIVRLMMLASPNILISVLYAGQDEIIYIATFFYALYCYSKNQKIKFYFWGGVVSVSLCPMMMLPYMIYILVEEKNIIHIMSKLCVALIPTLLYKIAFSVCISYRYGSREDNLQWIFGTSLIDMAGTKVSIVAIFVILILLYAYFDESQEKQEKALFLCAMTMGIIETIGMDHFYRRFLWIPFMILFGAKYIKNVNVAFLFIALKDIIQIIMMFYERSMYRDVDGWGGLSSLGNRIIHRQSINFAAPLSMVTSVDIIILKSASVVLLLAVYLLYREKVKFKIEEGQWRLVMLGCSTVFPVLLCWNLLQSFMAQ